MDSRLDAFLKTRSSCQCLEIFLRPSSGLFRETHRNDWHVGRAETSLRVFKRALCRRRSVTGCRCQSGRNRAISVTGTWQLGAAAPIWQAISIRENHYEIVETVVYLLLT